MCHAPDDGLPALVHRDVLHRDLLLSAGPVSLEGFHLSGEGSGELGEGAHCAVLLGDILNVIETARESHGRAVDRGHLSREHGFQLIPRLHAFDHREHEVEPVLVHDAAFCPRIGELPEEPIQEVRIRCSERAP